MDALIDELSKLVDITPKDIKRFKKLLTEWQTLETMPLRSQLSDAEVARFSAQQFRFPGVEIKARLFREYPFTDVTSHLIGYVGRINQNDIDQLEEDEVASNYLGSDYIGKTGIEQSYEKNCTAPPASSRSKWMPADAPCACCRAPRRSPATT